MANYASQLVKQLEKQINEQQKKEKEMRKGIVKIPSPSNNLKVADNSTAKSVNTSTGQTSGSISNGENLSDRGYSSTVDDFKSGNSSKGFSLTARMGSDLADYNALTIGDSYKGGNRSGLRKYKPSAKAKAEELKAKYGIDDKQLKEANIAYTKSKIENAAKKGRENAERFSENNHLVSELGRAVMRPFSNLEGYGNLISAKTKGKVGTQDYTMGNYTDALASGTDKAIENSNMSDTGKFVANTAVGLGRSAGDMAVNFALSRATGLPMGTFSAGNAANDYLRRATERGSDLDKAAKVAGANAAVDFALSNWGMDELLNVSKAGKNLGTTVAKSAGIEGLEEGVQNIAEQANDAFMNFDKSQYKEIRDRYLANGDSETVATLKTLRDLGIEDLQAAGAGALFGGLMPVGKAAVSKANANIPRVYLPQNKITNANVNTDTNVEAKPEVITEPTVNSEANVQEEITQPVVNNEGIKVYRGYNASDNTSDSNLTAIRPLSDFIPNANEELNENLPLAYYTESSDVADQYANQDTLIRESLRESATNDYVKSMLKGEKIPDRNAWIENRMNEKFQTLTGREYGTSKGEVKEHTINPNNVLDISAIGENPTVDEVYAELSRITGIPESELDNELRLSNMEYEYGDSQTQVPAYRILRNMGTTDDGQVGSRVVDFMRKHGYDAMRFAEQGTNQYAVLNDNQNVTENVPLDNSQVSDILNNVTTERGNANGQIQGRTSNDRTGSEGILHGVSEKIPVGQREYRYRIEGGEYLPPNRVSIAEKLTKNPSVFNDSDISSFENDGIEYNQLYDSNNDTALYSKALSTAIDNNDNGAAVDPRSAEEISEIISKGGKTFLSDDATAGIIIEGDGNLTGVFKDNLNNSTPRMGRTLAIAAVKNGAIKGDCFGRFLANSYSSAGLEPVARMKYGYGFNEKMDAQVREQIKNGIIDSEPDVYVLRLRSDFDPDTAIEYSKTAKQYTQEELDALPLFEDYDEMLEYRDRLLSGENVSPEEYSSYSADSMNEDIGIDNSPVVAERTSLPITDDIEPSSPELRYSDVTKNTGVNSGVVDADELDTADMRAVSEYLPTNNQESLKKAKDRASEDFEGWEERYASGKEEITNDVDVDTSMVILSKLKADMNAAVKNGDTELADTYRIRRNRLLEQLRKAGTKGGQMIQAFAKWNFTSDGAVLNAQKMLTDKAQKYLKSNAKEKQVRALSGKLLKALDNLVDDGTIKNNGNKDSLDVIKKKVQNTLEAEMISVVDNSDGTNPSKHEFTQDDVNFLANLINQGADADELTNYLATKFATGKFDVSDAAVSKVNELFDRAEQYGVNSKERVELEVEAWKVLADDLDQDATFWEKFDAWRYLAMLGNPKTHVRNMIGNAMFRQVTGFSNTLAASIEEWYSKTEKGKGMRRTKAVLDPRSDSDNALIDMSLNDIEDNSFRQLAGDKFNDPKQGINSQKRIFKLKNVEGARVVNNSALGTEDYSAKRKKYATSMAGFLKANGLDASAFEAENDVKRLSQDVRTYNEKIDEKKAYATNLENKAKKLPLTNLEQHSLDKAKNDIQTLKTEQKAVMDELNEAARVNKLVEEAREYAIKSAEYSTFNQNNKVANKLNGIVSELKQKPATKPLAMLIEGLIPFKRTPMNIVKSIYDYSPLGFVSAVANAKTSKSEFRTAETIDMISKASTGTLLAAVGFALQKLGIININNDDQQYTNPAEGKQQYSVIINGKSYTIDFAVPAVAPLLMGASFANYHNDNETFTSDEFMDALMDKDFGRVLNQISLIPKPVTSSLGSLVSPVFDTTMMSGINDTLGAIQNYTDDKREATSTIARSMLGSYFSQAVPTTMGQLSRTLDPTRRSTYSDETGGAAATDRSLMKMLNKTPLSRLNEPYVDSSGREQSNSPFNNIFANAAYQFLSPSYIQNVAPTDVEKQSDALYETTRDSNALLNSETSPKIKGSKLDKTDMTTWSKDYGQVRSDMRSELFASDYFKNLSPADKVEAIKDIDKAARNIANYNLAQGDNKLSDEQIEYASKTTDASSWESSGKDAKAFVDLYTKHQSLKQGAADSGVVSSNGQVNTDRYEKLETVTDGNKDVIAGLNECYNDSGKLDTAKSLEYFEKNNIPDSEAGRYMYELNGGADGGKKMQAAYKAFDYVGVKEYYNIRNYCGSDVTKQKVIDYLNSKGIKYNDKNTSAEYNKWMKDVFGFDPTTDGEGHKLK